MPGAGGRFLAGRVAGQVDSEPMTAARILGLRGHHVGTRAAASKEVVRGHLDFLHEERPLFRHHTRMTPPVESCEVLQAVETAVGSLE